MRVYETDEERLPNLRLTLSISSISNLDEVSNLLKLKPDTLQIEGVKSETGAIYRASLWSYSEVYTKEFDVDVRIEQFLNKLTNSAEEIKSFQKNCGVNFLFTVTVFIFDEQFVPLVNINNSLIALLNNFSFDLQFTLQLYLQLEQA
jgi:hypothetical protein